MMEFWVGVGGGIVAAAVFESLLHVINGKLRVEAYYSDTNFTVTILVKNISARRITVNSAGLIVNDRDRLQLLDHSHEGLLYHAPKLWPFRSLEPIVLRGEKVAQISKALLGYELKSGFKFQGYATASGRPPFTGNTFFSW